MFDADAFARLTHALAAQRPGEYLAWAMMLLLLFAIAMALRRQHRLLLPHLDEVSPEMQRSLYQLARSRGWILCMLWGLLTLTIILSALQHPADDRTAHPPENASIAPVQALPPVAAPTTPVLTRGQMIDRAKLYYEDAFVSYYYLNKCHKASEADNATLYHALVTELSAFGAESEARKVTDAASGSFEVIYRDSPCDAKTIAPVERDFNALILALPQRHLGDSGPH